MSTVPKNVKQPTDHMTKKTATKKVTEEVADKTFIKTELLGQTWKVDADTLDDFELLDDLAALQNEEDVTRVPSALRRLLGKDDYRRALDALRDDKGKVRIEPAAEFMMALIEALDPNS